VSVVAAKRAPDGDFDITLWLMSCRVLKRGMEDAMMDAMVAAARAAGAKQLRGAYYKTAKNAMVKDFYAGFGFERTSLAEHDDSHWRLALDSYQPHNHYIEVESR
ncbi:HAD family hydrolase, partial [Ruminococcaceae bacterium OttesenSCG-928-D13]|nr:HAD family hydrolase [Ruminococcaceae bacterium OttesenSCG-928-D13]